MNDTESEDIYMRNFMAEQAHKRKVEMEREKYEVVTEYEDGLVITGMDYTKNRIIIPGFND